ncbi:MAG: hypothetical protein KJ011_07790 [Burkholderiaceae bacterium]|nr:hypothetical protein [Burkholderiaceae bacterium]
MTLLSDTDRDQIYRAACLAISAAGPDRERLYLARLALLLMDELGDAGRCLRAIEAAAADLPTPRMS